MPTYVYECQKCKKTFETFHSMKDEPLKTCPKDKCCKKTWGKGKVKRLLSPGAGFIFKGSGFYITDYRSDSYKKGKESESAPKKDSAKSDAKPKTPSKPAKKTGS